MSRESRKRAAERIRAQQTRRSRRRRWLAAIAALVAAGAVAAAVTLAAGADRAPASPPGLRLASLATLGTLQPAPAPGPDGAEGVPVPVAASLASTASIARGEPVDGISCDTTEQTIFHIHAHLTVFVNGLPRQVPAGIGIPGAVATSTPAGPFISSGNCFYWLHTHAPDGVIHIESPVHRRYSLGEFFAEWGQPLGPDQVGPAEGHVTAIYDGRVYRGNPRDIPLTAHAQIQLEVGRPLIAPMSISWPAGL
jgi:hypothetical protein